MPLGRYLRRAVRQREWIRLLAWGALLVLGLIVMPAGPWWQRTVAAALLILSTETLEVL